MTERDWLDWKDVQAMLDLVSESATERKLRLFCLACCGRIWEELQDPRSQNAAFVLAAYADGKATALELHEAWRQAATAAVGDDEGCIAFVYEDFARWRDLNLGPTYDPAARLVSDAAAASARHAALWCATAPFPKWRRFVVRMLHDLFGNPFQPITISADHINENVLTMASRIYDRGLWREMPLLGDTLQAAGLTNEVILRHCRKSALHARGCWVLDGILRRT